MILVIPTWFFIIAKQIASQKWIRLSLLRWKEQIDWKLVEMIWWLETIRVVNTTNIEIQKIENIAEDLRKIEIKHHIYMMFYDSLKYLNEAFFYVLVVSLSIYFAVNWIITKWDMLTYTILFMSIITPIWAIHRILDEAHESVIKVKDLNDLLNQSIDESFEIKEKVHFLNSENALEIKN